MKKTLAIFSLTCCEGCQFEMLNYYEEFGKLLSFFEIKNFRLGQEDNFEGPFDVSIVEGQPDGEKQIQFVKHIREESGMIVSMGSCAHMGGIQSERNRLPKTLIDREPIKKLSDVIKVDYIVPGCPINHNELYRCLLDIYWGKVFTLPDLPVCYECRQNENKCLLRDKQPCLGPITRSGCNSICRNFGEACLGCRGLIPEPNIVKLKEILDGFISEKEIANLLSIYGDLEQK